jgi:hypothetical protein
VPEPVGDDPDDDYVGPDGGFDDMDDEGHVSERALGHSKL